MATLPTAITGAAARPSGIRVAIKRVVRTVFARVQARRRRREITDLLRFDDRMLKDIGLTRSDVVGVLTGSGVVDPSVVLRLRRGGTRAGQPDPDVQVLRVKHSAPPVVESEHPRLAA